jgi:tetratricopeptide (TPR) repeat protein
MDNPYAIAAALAENGNLDKAWKIVGSILNDNPHDLRALVTGSYIMQRSGSLPQAYHFARRATEIAPNEDSTWTNLGHAASQMWLIDEAERCYRRGLNVCKTAENRNVLWLNLCGLYIDTGDFEKAERYALKLLDVDPTSETAKANLGFCQLARRDWAEGWKNYRNTIGSPWRKRVRYKDEPEWDGRPGKNVVLYADQGLGDEISFASMLPDAAKLCKKLILDCDGRLEGLFRRSFPQVKVYGTRVKDEKWAKEDRDIEASLPLGQAGEFVRTKEGEFPGTPYLVPCPDRLVQWKTLFATKKKPIIGIAWTGGVPKTNARNRKVSLDDLLPVLSLDAHFVSLQYKDAKDEIARFKAKHPEVDLVQYSWATLTNDYDDTAALIAACDYVVCIQTAVAHTAGGLGVPVSVLLPTATSWRYGTKGDSIPWYRCLNVIRQAKTGEWSKEIERAARAAADFLGVSRSADEAA